MIMGVSVFGSTEKAGIYDNTTGALIGKVYRGHSNAKKELNEFVNNWLEEEVSVRDRDIEANLPELFTAYKVEKGFSDKEDWLSQIETAEACLDREIEQNSF